VRWAEDSEKGRGGVGSGGSLGDLDSVYQGHGENYNSQNQLFALASRARLMERFVHRKDFPRQARVNTATGFFGVSDTVVSANQR